MLRGRSPPSADPRDASSGLGWKVMEGGGENGTLLGVGEAAGTVDQAGWGGREEGHSPLTSPPHSSLMCCSLASFP